MEEPFELAVVEFLIVLDTKNNERKVEAFATTVTSGSVKTDPDG